MQIDAKLLVTIFGIIIAGVVGFYSARLQTSQEILELERKIDARALATSVSALRDELGEKIDEARVAALIADAKLGGLNQGQVNTLVEKQLNARPNVLTRDDAIALIAAEVEELGIASAGGLDRADVLALVRDEIAPFEAFRSMKGAVIAFDRSEDRGGGVAGGACPVGWKLFREAGGRMILGAGAHSNLDENGKALSDYRAYSDKPTQAVGGAETHTLEDDEMPSHVHGLGLIGTSGFEVRNFDASDALIDVVWYLKGSSFLDEGVESRPNQIMLEAGGNVAHNNMPPYIALYFCKKEVE